jgi:hypothetical protein|tara:strand:- start:148 stop:468 length:321 start_codon:yes stop_codon:yes gene_type:complete
MTEEKTNDTNKEQDGVPHLVSKLRPIAQQVGEHVLAALDHEETVAVLTTVTGSRNGQQVVSIPLSGEHLKKVHGLIEEIHESDEPERVPCVGFHCFIDGEQPKESE